jgi:hypothetical protein
MVRFRAALVLALALAANALTGCKSNCQQLSEQLCDCATNTAAKSACLSRASTEASNVPASSAQNQLCAQLMPVCDCHTINTYEGKVNCGLARQKPTGIWR